ncbi:tryptophan halogenase family protein [Qipengyuania vesicularis]|uniref:tryptophan halogenase family protein n=1 Tax=Qipengyuania vesicularis TaxID=2867232 RepID=UPI001C8859DA|nr:tryptophan halogenase family protein [Qipengyuania vesicularis]MBX7527084.1 tryptophan 7-halogenase [Qipengyuania vesicularis]
MSEPLTQRIVILGGGTSGWLCAAYMANNLGRHDQGGPHITLVESSDIPTIGVGEATIPPIKSAIAGTGLGEREFLKAANASFKLAIRFDGWMKAPADSPHSFYHAFGPHGRMGKEPLAPYWAMLPKDERPSFVDWSMNNAAVIHVLKGAKRPGDKDFTGPIDYAYHFDAGLLAQLLKERAKSLGVDHVVDTVQSVRRDGETILSITTDGGQVLEGDLFVDCSGFHARLIEKELEEPFRDLNDVLFCDRAIACPVKYGDPDAPILPYTKSTARRNGWIWDVPLQDRRGTGIVFSSRHTDAEEARADLLEYLGEAAEGATPRELKFRVGYRDRSWRGNCVAIGLSGGFIEPLESTGIYITDIAIRWLTDFCLPKGQYAAAAEAFNARIRGCYEDVIDFVKLHYVLSDRDDSDFWIENRDPASIPESLQQKLDMWSLRMPSEYEFGHLPAVFSYSNYVQVMLGMGFHPPAELLAGRFSRTEEAARVSAEIQKVAKSGVSVLPGHRELLEQLTAKA